MVPKLFVSYCWTDPDHEDWVLDLATQLRESGVDVLLDKWDLQEGQDAYAFMEKMVTDPEIKKVILICDRAYASKADARRGGVGTEAQIISPEIYSKTDQTKFVAVVKECDEAGRPCLPAYYKSRIYVDLSNQSEYATNFERLIRWIYDRPLYQKPELGSKPAFLSESESAVRIGNSFLLKRAVDAIKNAREHADSATEEYLMSFVSGLSVLRLDAAGATRPFDDMVVDSIASFLAPRNHIVELIFALAQYRDTPGSRRAVHRFFEALIPYLGRPADVTTWHERGSDNYRFLIHELYLYAVAALIRFERFDALVQLLETPYYVESLPETGRGGAEDADVFRGYVESLEHRNERLGLRRLSIHADLLKERCVGVPLSFPNLMQADFVLYLRSQFNDGSGHYVRWFPETLLYAKRLGPFEIFVRARSRAYFDRIRVLLRVNDRAELDARVSSLELSQRMPSWGFEGLVPRTLLGLADLASLP